MSVQLSEILAETNEMARNSTTGALDNNKRTRAINRVLRDLQSFADWDFTRRTKTFYFIQGVSEYSLENYVGATCFDNDGATEILDFKNPYDLRPRTTDVSLVYKEAREVRENVRRGKSVTEYAIDQDTLLVNFPRQSQAQLHNCDSLTANGTVAASGDATNLTIDSVIYSEGSGALNFDVSAGTSLVITFDGIQAKDLTTLQNKSHLTLKAWLPTITNFSSIKLEWGDDAGNNWSKTETAPAGGQALEAGKELLFAFRWADSTENGSPAVSSINWLRVTITYSSAVTDTDFRIDDIRIGEEIEMDLDYYSRAMVRQSDGDYQLEFDPDNVTQTDELLGDDIARNAVVIGTKAELLTYIEDKSVRDLDEARAEYKGQRDDGGERMKVFKKAGHRIRRPSRRLPFPSRTGRLEDY